MMLRKSATLTGAGLALAVFTTAAGAMTIKPGSQPAGSSVVEKVHGCHRAGAWGPVLGWHRHGVRCRPIALGPRVGYKRCVVNRFGERYCRW